MTKEELSKIRKNMPLGYLTIISERTGKTRDSVSKVLRGVFNSDEIIETAIILARETKEKKESMRKRIRNL